MNHVFLLAGCMFLCVSFVFFLQATSITLFASSKKIFTNFPHIDSQNSLKFLDDTPDNPEGIFSHEIIEPTNSLLTRRVKSLGLTIPTLFLETSCIF